MSNKGNAPYGNSNPVDKLKENARKRVTKTSTQYCQDKRSKEQKINEFSSKTVKERNDELLELLVWFLEIRLDTQEINNILGIHRNYTYQPEFNIKPLTNCAGLNPEDFSKADQQVALYSLLLDAIDKKLKLLKFFTKSPVNVIRMAAELNRAYFDKMKEDNTEVIERFVRAYILERDILKVCAPLLPDIMRDMELTLTFYYLVEEEKDGKYTCSVKVSFPNWVQLTFTLNEPDFEYESNQLPGSCDWCNDFWDDVAYSALLEEVAAQQKYYEEHSELPFAKLNLELLADLQERIKLDNLERLDAVELEAVDHMIHALLLGYLLLDNREEDAWRARSDKLYARTLCKEYGLVE